MLKIGIKIIDIDEAEVESLAQTLQRFIIEGDYHLSSIFRQIEDDEMIELDVSTEENMPEFKSVVEALDEEGVEYQLYQMVDEAWEACVLDDLDIERTPQWILSLIVMTMMGYFVMGFFEIFAIYDWYTIKYELSAILAAIGAVVTAVIPIVGSVVAYWSATELWEWESLSAGILYFWYYLPIIYFFFHIIYMILKALIFRFWYPFRYPEFN